MSSNYVIASDSFISEDELYHYGVKGMRWGIRNTKKPAKKRIKAKKDIVSEYKKERNRQKKHIVTKRAIDLGSRFINSYTKANNVTFNGKHVGIPDNVKLFVNTMLDYKYMKDTFK